MATIQELKDRIDLVDLAERLGWERPDANGNFRSPHRKDENPSVSVFDGGRSFYDHVTGQGGSCIDMIMYHDDSDNISDAVRRLHDIYNIPPDPPKNEPREKKSLADHIAGKCFDPNNIPRILDYLVTQRKIPEDIVKQTIDRRTVGFNDWFSKDKQPGQVGYGGPAVAFIVRSMNPGHVVAIDTRYIDPDLNGGVKTQCQGEKHGYPWTSDLHRLKKSRTVYLVESPINALSVEACRMPYTAAVAVRGASNIDGFDWHFLQGKRVILCMDNDEPNEKTGYPPGAIAAWKFLDQLTGYNISAHLVDQTEWEHNDINDVLKETDEHQLEIFLKRLNPYIIPGVLGDSGLQKGRPRIFLPSHDYAQYWRFRAKEDHTTYIKKRTQDDDGNEKLEFEDLCGFRLASISRVTIASASSTMTGDTDSQPRVLFSVSVQVPRHGNKLIRKVFDDDRLHNVEQWKKFGPVFVQGSFLRMINIMERSADLGSRDAINFVGLAWRNGKLTVNEGADCYFTEPDKQSPYHNLIFPTGNIGDARTVISAYQETFKQNAATIPLVWGLGGHLKAFLGFWPHITIQADKGEGKTTLINHLTRTIAFTMFSNESLKTAFRMLTSVSYTAHPVGWEEISANSKRIIDDAVSMLQQSYQYTPTKRGSDMTDYLISAPVMLAGEDVPVKSLIGKLVRTDLTGKKGPRLPHDLPKFPVRNWLQGLCNQSREEVISRHDKAVEYCRERCRSASEDSGASRMIENYAAVLVSWGLLCEFANIDKHQGNFIDHLVAEMNKHIADTCGDREPWVWILEIILHELAAGAYRMPYTWTTVVDDEGEKVDCLAIRTGQIMHHISTDMKLRNFYDGLPVKSDRVFKAQLRKAGVLVTEDLERTISGKRVAHLVAISLAKIDAYGLHATPPEVLDAPQTSF